MKHFSTKKKDLSPPKPGTENVGHNYFAPRPFDSDSHNQQVIPKSLSGTSQTTSPASWVIQRTPLVQEQTAHTPIIQAFRNKQQKADLIEHFNGSLPNYKTAIDWLNHQRIKDDDKRAIVRESEMRPDLKEHIINGTHSTLKLDVAIPTWDPKANEGKGKFVDARTDTDDYNPNNEKNYDVDNFNTQKDSRNFKIGSESPRKRGRDPNQKLLGNGKISLQQLHQYGDQAYADDVACLDPRSEVIRNILKFPLKQSWHVAKHELAQSKSRVKQSIMRKLWEFRQWHYDKILKQTKTVVAQETGADDGLTKWPSAGSTSLTSDIDVNLKGTQTEKAVEVFNRLFKADGWSVEAGVVYDVNVYAMDFMHAFKGVDIEDHKVVGKEGKREGQKQGGFKEAAFAKKDMEDQDEWSLVKLRLYISNPVQWDEYVEAAGLSDKKRESVEAKYEDYLQELRLQMQKQANAQLTEVDEDMNSGIGGLNQDADQLAQKQKQQGKTGDVDVLAEDLMISASNRIYEKKLAEVAELRQDLQETIANYNQRALNPEEAQDFVSGLPVLDIMGGAIEQKLKRLRKLVSECALYSNEAYVTDAAVNHVVVGMQGKTAIEQTKGELMQSVTENMADALKEISRHNNTLGEAAFKSGKYFFRMADAAKNMGFGDIDGVKLLYDTGREISVTIKGNSQLTGAEQESTSATRLDLVGIKTGSQLVATILEVGTAIRQAFTDLTKQQKQELGQPSEQI